MTRALDSWEIFPAEDCDRDAAAPPRFSNSLG